MKISHYIIFVILSALVAWAVVSFTTKQPGNSSFHETAYERVVRTNTLRCGYQYWAGAVEKDEKTGKFTGPWVEMMDAIGTATNLKIEWAEQVGWDEVGAALKSGKIDAMCAGMWTSAAKAREIGFSMPLAYQAIEAFVRADDHRFDAGLQSLNDPKVKIAVIDNDNSEFIAKQDYPKAQRIALGQINGTDGDLMLNVMNGKADITFTTLGQYRQFDKNNPGKLRRLAPDVKLRVFGLANAVDNDDPRLLNVLNAGTQEIANSGTLDKIIDQANRDYPDIYIKPLKPFP